MPKLEDLRAFACTVPTEEPQSDGTFEWNSTTLVAVEATAEGKTGIGYTYAPVAAGVLAADLLFDAVRDVDALDIPRAWRRMARQVRNAGRPGVASMAIAAVDAALWDLKARLLDRSLARLLGLARAAVPAYASGGFTSRSIADLRSEAERWVADGFTMVKIKVGSSPDDDGARVAAVRRAIGPDVQLFVDANGAYSRKQALHAAEQFAQEDVTWFEEPVSSDDLEGLRLLRDRVPAAMQVAAGEYGFDSPYFRRMMDAGAVDTLQADATRCGGITGFLEVGALCQAFGVPLSAHTAPALHTAPCCALPAAVHVEWFHDHVRAESLIFEGVPRLRGGMLRPDQDQVGSGLRVKRADAERFLVWCSA